MAGRRTAAIALGMLILLSTGMPSNASFTYTATFDPKSSFASPFLPDEGLVQGDFLFYGSLVEHVPDTRGGDSSTDGLLRSQNLPSQGIWVRHLAGQTFDLVSVEFRTNNHLPDGSATRRITITPFVGSAAGTPWIVTAFRSGRPFSSRPHFKESQAST